MASAPDFEAFLEKNLKIPGWRALLENSKSRLKLVQEIVLAFNLDIYWQNVTWSAIPQSERKPPSPEEALDLILTQGIGGCCIHLYYVLQQLLQFLGFEAYLTSALLPAFPETPRGHALVILKIPPEEGQSQGQGKGQLYAMDVGYARPILYLIPLHDLPFKGRAGGFNFEVRFNPETGNYERILFEGCPSFGKLKETEEGRRVDYVFDLTPRPFSDFDEDMTTLFVNPVSTFLGSVFLSRFTRVNSPEDYEYVSICRKTFVKGSFNTFEDVQYQTLGQVRPLIEAYFPKLDKGQLDKAIVNFELYEKKREAELAESEKVKDCQEIKENQSTGGS